MNFNTIDIYYYAYNFYDSLYIYDAAIADYW